MGAVLADPVGLNTWEDEDMAELMEAIKDRRSIRWYSDEPVSEASLAAILEAGRWAQSWANTQCWEVVVIRDPAVREAIQKTIPDGNPSHRAASTAPVLLAVCGRLGRSGFYHGAACTKFGDWFMFDLGIFTQNVALAAHGQGLGTVMLGVFDQDAAKQVLGLPEGYEVAVLMPVGHPLQVPAAPPRRELAGFVHYDTF